MNILSLKVPIMFGANARQSNGLSITYSFIHFKHKKQFLSFNTFILGLKMEYSLQHSKNLCLHIKEL